MNLKLYTMEIKRIYIGTTTYEGVEYQKARAVLADGRHLNIINDIDEVRELGDLASAQRKLTLKDGEYGPYLQISRYEENEELF